MQHIFGEAHDERRFVEQWCAWPIQHPGEKLSTGVLMVGTPGSGKSLAGEIIAEQHGGLGNQPENHAAEINQDTFDDTFNEWNLDKQFILANEMVGTDKRKDRNRTKNAITRKTIIINNKYGLKFTVRATDNYYATSNDMDALSLDDKDRRWFVWHVAKDLDEAQGTRFAEWGRSEQGKAALRHYFLNLNLTGFNPHGRAPLTAAKEDVIEAGYSDLERWVRERIAAQNEGKPVDADVHTLEWLAKQYDPDGSKRTSTKTMSNILFGAAATKIKARSAALKDDSRPRAWALANGEHWQKATPEELADALNKSEPNKTPKYWS